MNFSFTRNVLSKNVSEQISSLIFTIINWHSELWFLNLNMHMNICENAHNFFWYFKTGKLYFATALFFHYILHSIKFLTSIAIFFFCTSACTRARCRGAFSRRFAHVFWPCACVQGVCECACARLRVPPTLRYLCSPYWSLGALPLAGAPKPRCFYLPLYPTQYAVLRRCSWEIAPLADNHAISMLIPGQLTYI